MDSHLTLQLKKISNITIKHTSKFNISTQNIIAYGTILNSFAILNLIKGNFIVFILLFMTASYCHILAKSNIKKKNDISNYVRLFGRISVWIIIGTTFYGVYQRYKHVITVNVMLLFVLISFLCNINYSLKMTTKIDNGEFEHRGDLNSIFIKYWSKIFKPILPEKRKKIASITQLFDESMFVMYFIVTTIYLQQK